MYLQYTVYTVLTWFELGPNLDLAWAWAQLGSDLDPAWIWAGSSLDPIWIQLGSSLDPSCIQPGYNSDPRWTQPGSSLCQSISIWGASAPYSYMLLHQLYVLYSTVFLYPHMIWVYCRFVHDLARKRTVSTFTVYLYIKTSDILFTELRCCVPISIQLHLVRKRTVYTVYTVYTVLYILYCIYTRTISNVSRR